MPCPSEYFVIRRNETEDDGESNPEVLFDTVDCRSLSVARRMIRRWPRYASIRKRINIERVDPGVDWWMWEEHPSWIEEQ